MIIDCVSDLHGYIPELEGGDLLIVAGDMTAHGTHAEMIEFSMWLEDQKYKKIVVIPGNHDNMLMGRNAESYFMGFDHEKVVLLIDHGITFMGKKIWGMPWTLQFRGQNPYAKAFTFDGEEDIDEKLEIAPSKLDILVTHSPPYGILDKVSTRYEGSRSLLKYVEYVKPALHVFGHIHEGHGVYDNAITKFINASQVNASYKNVYAPIRFIL